MVDQILRTKQWQATIWLRDLSTIWALVVHPDLLPLNINPPEIWGPELRSTYSRVIRATNMRASSWRIFFQMLRDLCPNMNTELPRPWWKIPVLLSSPIPTANNSAENELRAIQAIWDLQCLEVYKWHDLGKDEESMIDTFRMITNQVK